MLSFFLSHFTPIPISKHTHKTKLVPWSQALSNDYS